LYNFIKTSNSDGLSIFRKTLKCLVFLDRSWNAALSLTMMFATGHQ